MKSMRTIVYVIFLTLSLLPIISCHKDNELPLNQAKWEVVNLNYTGDIDDIFALPNDTIMLISRYDDTFQKTCIFESDDAGKTWKQNCFEMLTPSGFANFYCFNHSKIYCGPFRTFNHGNSWQSDAFNGIPVYFVNDSIGFYIKGSSIYKTTDRGLTAEIVFDQTSFEGFQFIQFFDKRIGYASGGTSFDSYNSGIMVKTIDGGNTWNELPKEFKSIIGMSFINANMGYIFTNLHQGSVVGSSKEGAELLKTTDGGKTWISVNDKIYDEFHIIPSQCFFADEQHGFLCGSGNESKILSTSDGGKTWKEEYIGTSSDYLLNKIITVPLKS
jgi:photosystem II stability/assembly factor-like uncharacterized protein